MSNWKERLKIGSFSPNASLAIWGVIVLTLLMISLFFYAAVAGTAPDDRDGFNRDFGQFFQ